MSEESYLGKPKTQKQQRIVGKSSNLTEAVEEMFVKVETLVSRVTTTESKLAQQIADTKEQKAWLLYGFIVLCFTVAGMLLAVFSIVIDHITQRQESYDSLREEINVTKKVLDNGVLFIPYK